MGVMFLLGCIIGAVELLTWIRSLIRKDMSGKGIVIRGTAGSEWHECLDKVGASTQQALAQQSAEAAELTDEEILKVVCPLTAAINDKRSMDAWLKISRRLLAADRAKRGGVK